MLNPIGIQDFESLRKDSFLCQKSVRHAGGRAAATAVRAEFADKQLLL